MKESIRATGPTTRTATDIYFDYWKERIIFPLQGESRQVAFAQCRQVKNRYGQDGLIVNRPLVREPPSIQEVNWKSPPEDGSSFALT